MKEQREMTGRGTGKRREFVRDAKEGMKGRRVGGKWGMVLGERREGLKEG